MRLNVIVGYREFLQPFPIPWELLTTGFRTPESPVPPRFATAPWAPPLVDDPRYHGALLDPAEGTAELFLEYLTDTTAPNEQPWLVVPSVGVTTPTTPTPAVAMLFQHAACRQVRLAIDDRAVATLSELGGVESRASESGFIDVRTLGAPERLQQALRRNFSHHVARLAVAQSLADDFHEVERAASAFATKLDEFGLHFHPGQSTTEILSTVRRRFEEAIRRPG